ncbi:MAG: glutamate-cysteine ligase family protein [Bifidobacterium sp.]|uniref:Glutamate--cysteine ligase n=2 Tax=Bifidobacterium TaxID=1678 RepID=A0AB39UH46_9BIFI
MSINRVNYAHLLTKPNPKHLDSLMRFFDSGKLQPSEFGYGVEIEHLPVHNGDDSAVTYWEPNGIETLLKRLSPFYDKEGEYWENGHLVGLNRDKVNVSLEPGGQVECSIGIFHAPDDFNATYESFRGQVDHIADELGFRLVNYGYQPVTSFSDIPLNPKFRYEAMNRYLGRIGSYGPMMMRCSASTQVSIDYTDEGDSIRKMRVGTAIGPIIAWFLRNAPYFEGRENPYPLLRQRMWDFMDPQRTGIMPGLYSPNFSWETYAVDVLSTPLLFADLTHTPEKKDSVPDGHVIAWHENAAEIYPDRALNQYEINHVLSMHFNDVRMKNFLEFRHWDSLPEDRARRLVDIMFSLYYNAENLGRLTSYFDGLTQLDVEAAKSAIQANGAEATPYGQPMEFWQEFLGLEGLLSDTPGDQRHPDVFQA